MTATVGSGPNPQPPSIEMIAELRTAEKRVDAGSGMNEGIVPPFTSYRHAVRRLRAWQKRCRRPLIPLDRLNLHEPLQSIDA
jgi:hypothetical protein